MTPLQLKNLQLFRLISRTSNKFPIIRVNFKENILRLRMGELFGSLKMVTEM